MDRPSSELYIVYDRGRELDFYGVLLGQSSSFTSFKPRWFEVSIYKTEAGRYIVAGAGRSIVVHHPRCTKVAGRSSEVTAHRQDSIPCDLCNPEQQDDVVHEVDREWAQVSDAPEAVIERLRMRDSDGVMYIPRTSMTALQQAAELDDGIADALVSPQHVE